MEAGASQLIGSKYAESHEGPLQCYRWLQLSERSPPVLSGIHGKMIFRSIPI